MTAPTVGQSPDLHVILPVRNQMSFLKKLAKKVPAVRDHLASVKTLVTDNQHLHGLTRDYLARIDALVKDNQHLHGHIDELKREIGTLRELVGSEVLIPEDWSKLKKLKLDTASQERAIAA